MRVIGGRFWGLIVVVVEEGYGFAHFGERIGRNRFGSERKQDQIRDYESRILASDRSFASWNGRKDR